LLDILDARIDINATIIVGQRAVSEWRDWLDSPLIADAIMDRFVQRAHQFSLEGQSMRLRKRAFIKKTRSRRWVRL
jgi:DNA replication protein DnaC